MDTKQLIIKIIKAIGTEGYIKSSTYEGINTDCWDSTNKTYYVQNQEEYEALVESEYTRNVLIEGYRTIEMMVNPELIIDVSLSTKEV